MERRIHQLWPSWAALVGLVLVFIGERIFDGSPTRLVFAISGAAALTVAVGARAQAYLASAGGDPASADRKPVLRTLLLCTTGIATSMVLYVLVVAVFTGDDSASERMRGVLWALWPVVLAVSGLPLLFVETAVAPVAFIDRYERAHVRRSAIRGLSLALFLACLFVGNYLAVRHVKKLELGAGHSATASEQTRNIVRDLTKKVRVVLFFPRANDVAERMKNYFAPLAALNENLEFEQIDHALAFEQAKEAGVTDNGYVALFHEGNHEKIRVGTQERSARGALRRFDNNFVKKLIQVTTSEKTAYFFKGHDERPFDTPRSDDKRPALRKLKTQLEAWQYKVKPFSVAEGSTAELPKDADLIFIVGPEKPFLDAEIEVLTRALDDGVRMFIALEAERTGDPLDALLAPLGLKFEKTPLAATASKVPVTRTAADQSFVFSNQFSTHASVTTMTRNTGKIAAILFKPGALTAQKSPRERVKTKIVLRARKDTYADENDNLRRDPAEKADAFALAAAVTVTSTSGDKKKESRVFVLADADVMSDELFTLLPGNVYFLLDIVRWLQRDAETFVPTSSEDDVKIVHKGTEDALVFYGTTVGVPVLILMAGAFATRRRRRA